MICLLYFGTFLLLGKFENFYMSSPPAYTDFQTLGYDPLVSTIVFWRGQGLEHMILGPSVQHSSHKFGFLPSLSGHSPFKPYGISKVECLDSQSPINALCPVNLASSLLGLPMRSGSLQDLSQEVFTASGYKFWPKVSTSKHAVG